MKKLLWPAWAYVATTWTAFWQGWNRFWFTPADPTTLAAIRTVTGLVLLYTHLTTLPHISHYIGPNAWIDETAIKEILSLPENPADPNSPRASRGAFSIWHYVHDPRLIYLLYAVFLVGAACFTLGLFSRVASVIVFFGHVGFVQRAVVVFYGMDTILALLTLYLMFGPTGATFSLDAWLARRRAGSRSSSNAPRPSVAANFVYRLLQVHMCIIYLAAGFAKLQGSTWWGGTAIYMTMTTPEFALFDLTWMGKHDWLWMTISNFGVWFTLWAEIGFAFFIWHPRMKPIMLTSAFLLQLGIGVFMGLGSFQAAMFAGCLAFISPHSMRWFLNVLLGKEMPESTAENATTLRKTA